MKMKKISLMLPLFLATSILFTACGSVSNAPGKSEDESKSSVSDLSTTDSQAASSAETSASESSAAEEIKIPDVNVLARYTFDNISGTVVPDSGTKKYDGKFLGTPSVVDGKSGKAISLDGTNGILLPVEAGKVGKQFTVSAWFKIKSTSPQHPYRILSTGCWGPKTTGFTLGLDTSYGKGGIIYCVGNAKGDPYWNRQTEFPATTMDDKWHHLAIAYDMDSMMAVGFLDGQMLDLMMLPDSLDASPMAGLSNICIGGANADATLGEGFVGVIDDVVILNNFLDSKYIPFLMDDSLFSK